MALIKKSKLNAGAASPTFQPRPPRSPARAAEAAKGQPKRSSTRPQDRASERLAAATEQLAGGLSEASAAAEELRQSMEQIAGGASEAAGAAHEQLSAIKEVVASLGIARKQADATRRRTEAVEIVLAEAVVQIGASVRTIERNGTRQGASVGLVTELERRAGDIGEITRAVSRISDQTNLLALNAAIEAARAGDHGRGFAVVADEVRSLAETSETSAQEVQQLVAAIQTDVREVAAALQIAAETAVSQTKEGTAVIAALDALRLDMQKIAEGSQDTLAAAQEADKAAIEAENGATLVASAAEEQATAANQAQAAVAEQAKALSQGQSAAHELARATVEAQAGRSEASTAEQIGATAEELSATVQELSSASSQIMAALTQIQRGTQQQAAATHQSSAAMEQIEKNARQAQQNASSAAGRLGKMSADLKSSAAAVQKLLSGVTAALETTRTSRGTLGRLESVGRRIEKIVNAIGLVVVQTSMLAVSGAVEAARAGEAGRGFAVVSHDIRGLAREASDSAERIKETVGGILEQIASLRRDLEQILDAAELEVGNNRSVLAAFDKVERETAALEEANAAILQGAEQVLGAASQAAAGARQIASAAEEASAAARQAATAADEQAKGAEDLAAAVEEIASLADALNLPNG